MRIPSSWYKNPYPLLFCLGLISAGSRAASDELPIRAVNLFAHYQGQSFPIEKVKKQKPEINVGGSLVVLEPNTEYSFAWNTDFGPGIIHVKEQSATTTNFQNTAGIVRTGQPVDLGVDYFAEIVSSQSLSDCYVALICFEPPSLSSPGTNLSQACFFSAIGNLKAGHVAKVKLSVDADAFPRAWALQTRYFPVFFSGGRQIRADNDTLSLQYFDEYRHRQHQAAVQKYLEDNLQNDRAVSIFLMMPLLPDSDTNAPLPAAADITLDVDDHGLVSDLKIATPLPPAFEKKFRALVSSWLFLPAIHSGIPVARQVHMIVPLTPKT